MDLPLTSEPGRGCVVVRLDGVLDLSRVPQLRAGLQRVLDDGAQAVVLDLAGVRLVDSTALGMFVWLYKQLQGRDGTVSVAAPQPLVRKVLDVTSVDRLIRVYDTVEAAEADLPGA